MIGKISFKNFLRYIRFHMPVIIILIIGFSVPIILSGIFNGMHRSLKDKFVELFGGSYTLYAYSDSYMEESIMDEGIKADVDSILSAVFPSYTGSDLNIHGVTSYPMPYVVVSSQTVPDGTVYVESEDAKAMIEDFFPTLQVLLNPMPNSGNVLLQKGDQGKERVYADVGTAKLLRGNENGFYDVLILRFKKDVDYRKIREALEKEYAFYDEISGMLIPHSDYTKETTMLLPDLDTGLVSEIYQVLDSGFAEGTITKIEEMMDQSDLLSCITAIFSAFAAFLMARIMMDHRKREYVNLRLIGGSRPKVFSMLAYEELIVSVISFIAGLIVILLFLLYWRHTAVFDEYTALLFTRNGEYQFFPTTKLVVYSVLLVFVVPILSCIPSAVTILRGTPLSALNRLFGGAR